MEKFIETYTHSVDAENRMAFLNVLGGVEDVSLELPVYPGKMIYNVIYRSETKVPKIKFED